MAKINVGILGLGRVGASVALALKRNNMNPKARNQFSVTAYTSDPEAAKIARERKLADKVSQRVGDAVRNTDILFMALPYAEVKVAYEMLAQDVRPGAVVFDMTPLKERALAWSNKVLPAEVHVVGMTAIFNPRLIYNGLDVIASADEGLFDGGTIFLMPGKDCAPAAIDLGSDICALMGSQPQFIDPLENDSLMTATDTLPALAGVAYYWMMSQTQGWRDAQRLTNPPFATLTSALFDTHPDDLSERINDSQQDLLRNLDQYIATLTSLRAVIADQDRDSLAAVMARASKDYEGWINRRTNNQWDNAKNPADDAPGMMSALLGGFMANKFRRGKKDEE